MIRKLKGIIDSIDDDSIIVDVGGVGYGVFCSANTIAQLPGKGKSATVFIETHVREDHIHLYGFATADEQDAFRIITKVSGIGAKMGMAILSGMSPAQLANAIAAEDKAAFKNISGVGPKLASRIVTELKGKFAATAAFTKSGSDAASNVAKTNSYINDAISALVNLGYGRSDSYNAVTKIAAQNDNISLDMLIRDGLKELGSK